mgnify:CR=1 FL=1
MGLMNLLLDEEESEDEEERERIDTHMSQFMTFKVSDEIRNDEL